MTELDEILEKADYFDQLRHQRELLAVNFQDACIFVRAGGIFQLTPEFISGVSILAQSHSEIYVLDKNQNAILIKDPEEFINKAVETYHSAMTNYAVALNELKKQRSVRSIIES